MRHYKPGERVRVYDVRTSSPIFEGRFCEYIEGDEANRFFIVLENDDKKRAYNGASFVFLRQKALRLFEDPDVG